MMPSALPGPGRRRVLPVTRQSLTHKFNVNGQPATVFDLRKGMVVAAEKIVEVPRTEFATNVAVTGQAPPAPTPVVAQTRPAQAPVQQAAAPAPAPMQQPSAAPAPTMPDTASPFPLAGALGAALIGASFLLRRR